MSSVPARVFTALVVVSLAVSSLVLPAPAAEAEPIAQLRLRVRDASTGVTVLPLRADHDQIELPNGSYDFVLVSDVRVARMRMEARNGSECPLGRLADVAKPDDPTTESDDTDHPRFRRGIIRASAEDMTCEVVFNAWYENHEWAGHLFVDIVFSDTVFSDPESEPEPVDPSPPATAERRFDITVGTDRATAMDDDTDPVDAAAHGVRVYCPISHFSYDDPITQPGNPGATHLHMFWGNTGTDADSTADSLLAEPTSSCEGGRNNASAYWMPAVFNDAGEVLLPESAITYYKSFGHGPDFDPETIQPIPNGLAMIANLGVENGGEWNLQASRGVVRGVEVLRFNILFPQCLAIDNAGEPVLSTPYPHTDHLSYAVGGANPNHCPSSHPYRIPQVIYNVRYALGADEGWSLSSDPDESDGGHHDHATLHADYIAAWDVESMTRITQCNIDRLHMCQFRSDGGELRDQLAERFVGADGTAIYSASDQLLPTADRTPFGDSLTKMAS